MPRRRYNTKDFKEQANPEHMELLPDEQEGMSDELFWHFSNLYRERYRPIIDHAYDSNFSGFMEQFPRNSVTRRDIKSSALRAYLWCTIRSLSIGFPLLFFMVFFGEGAYNRSTFLPMTVLLFAYFLYSYIYTIREEKKDDAPNPCPAKKGK